MTNKKEKCGKWKIWLIRFSLVCNILGIISLGYVGYVKRNQITEKLYKLFPAKTSQVQLEAMNHTFVPQFTDFYAGSGEKAFNFLIIGNSLSSHEPQADIGWNYAAGMAATSIEKDYAHLILYKLKERLPNYKINMRIAQFAAFERNPNSLDLQKIDSLVSFMPKIVIFQLSENLTVKKDGKIFQEKYIELIKRCKNGNNVETILTTSFWANKDKNNIAENVALQTNSYLVDLSHLPQIDSEMYAKNESNYSGNKSEWKVEGIGMHPGDLGMEKIAQEILITINAILSSKDYGITK
jgi:hypothetical protein